MRIFIFLQKIPAPVVKVLKRKLGYVPLKGNIRLVELYDDIDLPETYSIHNDGRMTVSGFSDFAKQARLRVKSIVRITIERRTIENRKLLSLMFNCLS